MKHRGHNAGKMVCFEDAPCCAKFRKGNVSLGKSRSFQAPRAERERLTVLQQLSSKTVADLDQLLFLAAQLTDVSRGSLQFALQFRHAAPTNWKRKTEHNCTF